MNDDLPNFTVLDLESARLASRDAAPGKIPISVLSAWGLRDLSPHVWLLDEAKLPRTLIAEASVAEYLAKYDGIVTWNGLRFDGPCIKGQLPDAWKVIRRKRHVDLHAICALLSAGLSAERIVEGLDESWPRLVPTLRADLVNVGWSLEAVAVATLGQGKVEGPSGAAAVDAWNQGLYSQVISYNLGDVAITKEIFVRAWRDGQVRSRERGVVNVPRGVLALSEVP